MSLLDNIELKSWIISPVRAVHNCEIWPLTWANLCASFWSHCTHNIVCFISHLGLCDEKSGCFWGFQFRQKYILQWFWIKCVQYLKPQRWKIILLGALVHSKALFRPGMKMHAEVLMYPRHNEDTFEIQSQRGSGLPVTTFFSSEYAHFLGHSEEDSLHLHSHLWKKKRAIFWRWTGLMLIVGVDRRIQSFPLIIWSHRMDGNTDLNSL